MKSSAKTYEGASAVIGVILIVAITVILTAIIAAYSFNISNNIHKPYIVSISISKLPNGDIILENYGGLDVSKLKEIYVTYEPVKLTTAALKASDDNPETANTYGSLLKVGGSYTIPVEGFGSPKIPPTLPTHIIVKGTFTDGREQVLVETDI